MTQTHPSISSRIALETRTGRRIRDRRRVSGLTRSALATRIGCTVAKLGRYERGAEPVGFATVTAIAQALACNARERVEVVEAPRSAAPPAQLNIAHLRLAGVAELMDAHARVSPSMRQSIVSPVTEIADDG